MGLPIDPSMLMNFLKQGSSVPAPAELTSSNKYAVGPSSSNAVPDATPAAPPPPIPPGGNGAPPPAKPPQQERLQGIKGYLSNILHGVGEGMKTQLGMETDAQQEQRLFNQNLKSQELQLETKKTNSALQLQQAQIEQMKTLVEIRLPDGTIARMPYGVALKTYPAIISGQSKVEATKLSNQGKIDLQTLKGQSPLTQAQAHLANATADLKEAMNDPDSPTFKLAMQKVQWANYYKQKALDAQNQRLAMQREGMDFREYGPTANIRTQGQMSSELLDHVGKIRDEISSLGAQGKLGPLSGRFNEFMAGKIGAGDPAFTELRTDLGLFQTALMKAHVGSRGSEMMMEHFKGLLDSGKMTPEALDAAMNSVTGYLKTYVKGGQFVPPNRNAGGAPTPPAQKQWNPQKGIYE